MKPVASLFLKLKSKILCERLQKTIFQPEKDLQLLKTSRYSWETQHTVRTLVIEELRKVSIV